MKPEDVVSAFKKVSSDFQYFYGIKENQLKSNENGENWRWKIISILIH